MVLKVIEIKGDVKTDGASVAREFRMAAKDLRDSYLKLGDGDFSAMFDWAERTDTDFAKRERIYKESLR